MTNRPGRKRFALWLVVVLACGGALALASDEVPRWAIGGTRMVAHQLLEPVGEFPLSLPPDARIVVIGDSNSTARRLAPGQQGWPQQLQQLGPPAAAITNLSTGGATSLSASTAHDPVPGGDLCIIMLGTNDAASRGLLADREAMPLDRFRAALGRIVTSCRAAEMEDIVILAPPPAGSAAMDRRIEPYRAAARAVAVRTGTGFLDPAAAFVHADEPMLQADALHLSAAAHAALASWLAAAIWANR